MPKILEKLMSEAKKSLSNLKGHRKASVATKYKMEEASIGALSVFIMQDPSFLSHQERLSKGSAKHNFKGLFGCDHIPSSNQIRNLLDKTETEECESLYHNGLRLLEKEGGLSQFEFNEGSYLIALDGTEYYKDNVHKLACGGRARWHLENENNNTLKTKGYRFGHNYGHGKHNLCAILASFAIVAFLYHTIMGLVDLLYIKAKAANGSRINFFNMIKYATCWILFASWDSLMAFIIKPPNLQSNIGIL